VIVNGGVHALEIAFHYIINILYVFQENLQKLKQRAAASSTGPTSLKKPALSSNSSLQNKAKVPISQMVSVSPTKLLTRSEQYIQVGIVLE
jgi:hypothetical protein